MIKKITTAAERLQYLVTEGGVDRNTVATNAGINYYTLAKYMDGTRVIKEEAAEKLANYFSVLLSRQVKPSYFQPDEVDVEAIPMYAYSTTGEKGLTQDNLIGEVQVMSNTLQPGEYVYLESSGAVMYGRNLFEGGRILVRLQDHAADNKVALINIYGKTLLRIVRWTNDGRAVLYPINPDYEVYSVAASEFTILGQAVKAEFDL